MLCDPVLFTYNTHNKSFSPNAAIISKMDRISRRRTILIHAALYLLAMLSSQVSGFVTAPFNSRTMASDTSIYHSVSQSGRLSQVEQTLLLQQAVEARILKSKEKELAMNSPKLQISQLELSRALGYDLEKIKEIENRGYLAREQLVTRNMGLVYYSVNEIMGRRRKKFQSLSHEDLVQEGAIGLARAVDRWNPEIGGKFSTYAMYWIRAAIFRCIAERDDIIRVPEHVSGAVRKMTLAAKTLGLDIHGESFISQGSMNAWNEARSAKILAETAGLSEKQLDTAMKVNRRRRAGVISFEVWMQKGKDLDSDYGGLSETQSMSTTDKEQLKEALGRFLGPREIEALSWRYGLNEELITSSSSKRDYLSEAERKIFGSSSTVGSIPAGGRWGESMSFVEIGKRMQVSAEYCRRLCHAALGKLRQAAEEGILEPALLK